MKPCVQQSCAPGFAELRSQPEAQEHDQASSADDPSQSDAQGKSRGDGERLEQSPSTTVDCLGYISDRDGETSGLDNALTINGSWHASDDDGDAQ